MFGRVDLLVPTRHFARATTVLADASPTAEVEVHRIPGDGAAGVPVDVDDLFAPPYRFPLGKYELEALPMPQRLLHACSSAETRVGPPRLVSLRDVAEIVLRERPHLVDVLLMAKQWRGEAVVARAVTLTWRELRIEPRPPIVEWADRFAPGRDAPARDALGGGEHREPA